VYIGSSIYTAGIGEIVEKFGVSVEASSLGLALYVLACKLPLSYCQTRIADQVADGTGPMLFSPLSEYVYIPSQ
jgi:hypothetical protein